MLFPLLTSILPAVAEPPNAPAELSYDKRGLILRYGGRVIFEGRLEIEGTPYVRKLVQKGAQGQIDQVFAITGRSVRLDGTVHADEDSFACAAEPTGYSAPPVVRHSFGRITNGLNRAVYERREDWLLSIDHESEAAVAPSGAHDYSVRASGSEIIVRFRPRYYARHRGLRFFQPWTKKVKTRSEVGWCSWFAFWDRVTQNDIHAAADVLSAKLRPFGLDTLQIDDGFQRLPVGMPETWTQPNAKFPDGMTKLAEYIRSRGLVPGVWLTPSVFDDRVPQAHPDLFVRDEGGKPVKARWIGYPIDGTNPKAVDTFVRTTFGTYAKTGWGYFKMDALRHLRYEGYNSQADFFRKKGIDRAEAFRNVVRAARESVGDDRFLMACWGIMPDLAGIVDAVRIGGDGFGYESMAQYNSFNNVVWRNDPDHIQATHEFGYRDCTITSLTGSLYMLTDTPDDLRTKDLSAVKATIPVLFTRPGQTYDVDPSRSVHLDQVNTETSGGGPRAFDASRSTTTGLFQLDVNAGWGEWTLLARANDAVKRIEFEDLGLKKGKPYLVFEFWTKRPLGVFTDAFEPGEIDPKYRVQLFCVRPVSEHPMIVASDRHISCGALEMTDVRWNDGVLSGKSARMKGEPYVLYVYEPAGTELVSAPGTSVVANGIRAITLPPGDDESTAWKIEYRKDRR